MNIAFLQRELPGRTWNGVATQVHDLANALIILGHSVTLFSTTPGPEDARYAVHRIAWPPSWEHAKGMKRYGLGWLFAKQNYSAFDVVHAHGDNAFLFLKKKQVRTFYGSALAECWHAQTMQRALVQLLSWPLEWLGSAAAHYRTVISPATRQYLPLVDRTVPCGVDRSLFFQRGNKTGHPTVLFVGGLHDRKRGRWLLQRWVEVCRRAPGAELWVVGSDRAEGEGVRYLGALSRKDLAEAFSAAWVLVSPSLYEGFGLTLLEAMASGTPVVATPNDGSRYVLERGLYGALASDAEFSDRLTECLALKEKRDGYAAAGLKRAEEWDIRAIANIYIGIYERLLKTV